MEMHSNEAQWQTDAPAGYSEHMDEVPHPADEAVQVSEDMRAGMPIGEKMLQLGFIGDLDAMEHEIDLAVTPKDPMDEKRPALHKLPTCDKWITTNCQPVCSETMTTGCTEARTPHQPDPNRYNGANVNSPGTVGLAQYDMDIPVANSPWNGAYHDEKTEDEPWKSRIRETADEDVDALKDMLGAHTNEEEYLSGLSPAYTHAVSFDPIVAAQQE